MVRTIPDQAYSRGGGGPEVSRSAPPTAVLLLPPHYRAPLAQQLHLGEGEEGEGRSEERGERAEARGPQRKR